MKFSNEQNEKYAFVANCGHEKRIIARVSETVYAGCRAGTRQEVETAICEKYEREWQSEYLANVDLLFKSKLSDFKDFDNLGILYLATTHGLLELLQILQKNGVNIHKNNYAFNLAAEEGHLEIVKYLHQNGANIHAHNSWGVRVAAKYGHLNIVKYLHENSANIHAQGDWAIQLASFNGHLEVVKYLNENGADIHANDGYALVWAKIKKHTDVVKYLELHGA